METASFELMDSIMAEKAYFAMLPSVVHKIATFPRELWTYIQMTMYISMFVGFYGACVYERTNACVCAMYA